MLILITDFFDLRKIIDILLGKRLFIGDSHQCQLLLNYLKTVDDINNWIVSLNFYYEHEIKIVNMKHPKYKQIIRLINLSLEHGIFQQKVNRFKHGFLLLSNFFERFIDPEQVKNVKQKFNQKKTSEIKFEELINIFVFLIINCVVEIVVFIFELMYFFFTHKKY